MMFSRSFIRTYFSISVWLDILCEFCFRINYRLLSMSFKAPLRSFAVVIRPMEVLREPRRMKVAPYLFYRSKDTPPILHSWKNELIWRSERPKWTR
jgi:hypothetical protein